MLPSDAATVGDITGTWWIAHTKARAEKAFAWDLVRKGIAHFLPMAERVRVYDGRKRRMMIPLFPSYVFFCGDEEARYNAFQTDRLANVIPVKEQGRLVSELVGIERAVRGSSDLELYQSLPVGRFCRVTGGPLAGLEGIVVRRDDVTKFVVQVTVLGFGAALNVDPDLLTAVDSESV
jgi:transcriptional antiterminator RfaH